MSFVDGKERVKLGLIVPNDIISCPAASDDAPWAPAFFFFDCLFFSSKGFVFFRFVAFAGSTAEVGFRFPAFGCWFSSPYPSYLFRSQLRPCWRRISLGEVAGLFSMCSVIILFSESANLSRAAFFSEIQ